MPRRQRLEPSVIFFGGIMRRTIIGLLLCCITLACGAVQSPEGRWEGLIRIPGSDQPLVVDLAQGSTGGWTGSVILSGLGIKGAPLSNIVVTDGDIAFDMGAALGDPNGGPARFRARRVAADGLAGEMRQAGNVANFSLARIGPAQVELPARSTPVGSDIESQWSGEFDLGGYPRRVTITLENHANAGATATFVIVGKRTTELPVDLVIHEGDILRLESQANRVTFEGRVIKQNGEIKGTIELGPIEVPVVLHRAGGRS
jgi:hypothetical protein